MSETAGTVSTFAAEDELPRVPVPALADSAAQFLDWCAPLLDEEQASETRAAVEQLLRGPGPVLQAALEDYAAAPTTHSWLDAFWESRYLGRRDRIALNANFFFLFTPSTGPTEEDQAARAAGLVLGALDHKHRVDTGTLPPATRRGAPTTMEQHKFLFSATRIPGEEQDTARTPYTDAWPGPSRERHVVVFVRGNAFRLDVLGPEGVPHTATELTEALRALRADVDRPGPGVGALTTKARAAWAASRRALRDEHRDNAAALETIETALFCVSLEDGERVAISDNLAAAYGALDQAWGVWREKARGRVWDDQYWDQGDVADLESLTLDALNAVERTWRALTRVTDAHEAQLRDAEEAEEDADDLDE